MEKQLLIIFALLLSSLGCARTYTREECIEIVKPETMEQANAMGKLQKDLAEAKGNLSAMKSMETLKFWCGLGFVGAVVMAFLWSFKFGIPAVIASLAGFWLATMDMRYPQWIPIVGAIPVFAGVFYAIWLNRATIKAAVMYGQDLKDRLKDVPDAGAIIEANAWANKVQPKSVQVEIKKIKVKEKK